MSKSILDCGKRVHIGKGSKDLSFKKALNKKNSKHERQNVRAFFSLKHPKIKSHFRCFAFHNSWKIFLKKRSNYNINGRSYCNEIIREDIYSKPYLDIDIELSKDELVKKYEIKKECLDEIINDSIEIFKEEYNVELKRNNFKILESSGYDPNKKKEKLSFHIIISDKKKHICFNSNKMGGSSTVYHYYLCLKEKGGKYKKYIDGGVYTKDREFRLIDSYKELNDNRKMIAINHKTYKKITKKLSPTEKLEYFITHKSKKKLLNNIYTPIICKEKKYNKKDFKEKAIHNNKLLELVKKHVNNPVYKSFNGRFYTFDYDHSTTKCSLCNRIHERSQIYVYKKIDGYYLGCYRKAAEALNNEEKLKYLGLIDINEDKYKDNCTDIEDRKYLIPKDVTLTNHKNDIIKSIILKWIHDGEIKTLVGKSPMGTGKSTLLKMICKYKNRFKNILVISYRKTLTSNHLDKLKDNDFVSYLDIKGSLYNYKRVICQYDSIERLQNVDKEYRKYDLIIIDEIESVLNHTNSQFLDKPKQNKNARNYFYEMTKIIEDSNKIIALDADYNIRSAEFVRKFGKSIMFHNKYLPKENERRKFIFTKNKEYFNRKIEHDIINKKKKVCMVSMSSNQVISYANYFLKKGIRVKYYVGMSDDKEKKDLEDVDNVWINYDLVLFSPTIESGVDFNVQHFDKVYGILRAGKYTTSQRGFLQMTGRTRELKEKDILCFVDRMIPMYFDSALYEYEDVYTYYINTYGVKSRNIRPNQKKKKIELDLFDEISIYNLCESLNKHPKLFLTELNNLILMKGYEMKVYKNEEILCFDDEMDIDKIISGKELMIDKYMNIDKHQNHLYYYHGRNYDIKKIEKKKISNGNLTSQEKLILNHHEFLEKWGITNIDDKDLLRTFYEKHQNKDKLLEYAKNFNKIGKNTRRKDKKIIMVEDILKNILNIKKDNFNNYRIHYKDVKEIMKKINKNHQYFNGNDLNYHIDYELAKTKYNGHIRDPMLFWKRVNVICKRCNLKIIKDRKSRKNINNKEVHDYIIKNNKLYQDIIDIKENYIDVENLDFAQGKISFRNLFE